MNHIMKIQKDGTCNKSNFFFSTHYTISVQCRTQDLALALKPSRPVAQNLPLMVNFAINGNYHGNLDFLWLLSPVTMVVAIDDKVTISGKFCATGHGLLR